MKRLFVSAVALALFATVPALAARDDNHQGGKRATTAQSAKPHSTSSGTHQNAPGAAVTGRTNTRTGGPTPQGATPGNRSAGAAATGRTQTNPNAARPQGATPGNRSAGGAVTGATRANTNAVNSRGARTQNRSPAGVTTNSRGNSMSGNNAGRQPSINSLRRNVQAPRRFHNGSYRAPQGYQARRWSHGNRLPRNYFVRDYWITNFMMFGLFAPPPNLVWVRVGNDALLVDRYSGDIVQVDYGVFY